MEVKLKEVSRDELWKRALSSPEIEAREALEQLSITAESAEVQKFAELFSCRTHWLDRVEVVEALGRIANSEAVEMLVEIVMKSVSMLGLVRFQIPPDRLIFGCP